MILRSCNRVAGCSPHRHPLIKFILKRPKEDQHIAVRMKLIDSPHSDAFAFGIPDHPTQMALTFTTSNRRQMSATPVTGGHPYPAVTLTPSFPIRSVLRESSFWPFRTERSGVLGFSNWSGGSAYSGFARIDKSRKRFVFFSKCLA